MTITITLNDDGMGPGYVRGEPESEKFRLRYDQNVEALFRRAYPDRDVQIYWWCGRRKRDEKAPRVYGLERDEADPILLDAWERTCSGELVRRAPD